MSKKWGNLNDAGIALAQHLEAALGSSGMPNAFLFEGCNFDEGVIGYFLLDGEAMIYAFQHNDLSAPQLIIEIEGDGFLATGKTINKLKQNWGQRATGQRKESAAEAKITHWLRNH